MGTSKYNKNARQILEMALSNYELRHIQEDALKSFTIQTINNAYHRIEVDGRSYWATRPEWTLMLHDFAKRKYWYDPKDIFERLFGTLGMCCPICDQVTIPDEVQLRGYHGYPVELCTRTDMSNFQYPYNPLCRGCSESLRRYIENTLPRTNPGMNDEESVTLWLGLILKKESTKTNSVKIKREEQSRITFNLSEYGGQSSYIRALHSGKLELSLYSLTGLLEDIIDRSLIDSEQIQETLTKEINTLQYIIHPHTLQRMKTLAETIEKRCGRGVEIEKNA